MNLHRLCRNSTNETTPLYKIKVGSPVYLFNASQNYSIDEEAHLRGEINPNTGMVILISHTGKKIEFEDFRCVIVK